MDVLLNHLNTNKIGYVFPYEFIDSLLTWF